MGVFIFKYFPSANAGSSASRTESPLLPVTAMQPTRSSLLWLLFERQSVTVVGGEGVVGVASTCVEARGRVCCFLLVSSVALFLPRAQELLTLVFLCLSPGGAKKPTIKKKK